MISAGSVESDSSTAPSTDCSASRFCGGASGAALKPLPLWVGALMRAAESRRGCGRTHVRPRYVQRFRRRPPVNDEAPALRAGPSPTSGCREPLLLLDDHGLDGRDHAVLDL